MFSKLLAIFIGVPLVEILILIKLGEVMGFWNTILLVIGTGIVGAYLAKLHGLTIWYQIQQDLQMGHMPTDKLMDGLLVLVGGIVLLTPGLLTDILGLALLFPLTRTIFKQWLRERLTTMAQNQESGFFIR
ncbi:MAG: membrane protein FxsA [Candidatus Marinimicrobia bacterium]|nr:membrane protein FxsA [Candidatus Neomarinimicrobiota bacterium]